MPRTLLVVEDNAAERNILSGFLKHAYNVIAVESGRELFEVLRARAKSVSAILLDLVMPEMDGFEALRKIRDNAVYRQIPVIAVTGLTDEESQVRAMRLGANGYVFKPYNQELLKYTLENAIELREKSSLVNTFRKDTLTGLLSRTAFFETAEGMLRGKAPGYYVLACLDIENFKVINDQYGVAIGDEVLKRVAETIQACMQAVGGVCCRYSADKFGALYPAALRDSETIRKMHETVVRNEHLRGAIKIRIGRYLVDDLTVPIGAMYDRATLAEESIRGRYDAYLTEYTDSMRAQLLNEQKIVNDMGPALSEGEFEPWFQPQYNHATGALIGAEALVRWKRDGVYVSPAAFIPVFERNGFIYEMDQYIWEQVCRLLRRWLDEGPAPLPVSVNISRLDLFHPDFMDVLTGLVKKYRIPYELLRLEVTESAFAEASGQIVAKVGKLIEMGFTVEIDDFGSGYSSLNTLKDVPAAILKLDMKFFENTKNQQRGGNIVESVVRMSKWLGMAVIAEGVEEQEQADYLRSIGCYYIQGYYYAKPMPAAAYEKLLTKSGKEPELTRLKTLKTLDNSEFWNPKSMETLIFNSYVGGACIFEFQHDKAELLRVNEQYVRELGGLISEGVQLKDSSLVRFLDQENKDRLIATLRQAIDEQKEAACEVRLAEGPHTEYVRVTVRLIARASERFLFYGVILNMTEQREAERKQAESARQLEIIMGNVNGGVSAIQIEDDGTSRFVFCNERYYELYGYTRQQAEETKLDVMRLIEAEDFPSVMEKVQKLKKDRAPAIIDYRITKRGGGLAYLRANASLMYMEGYGDVITSVVTDITEQRELHDKFKAVIDNINGGVSAIYLKDGKPEYVIVNDRYYSIIGYTRQQFEAEVANVFDLVHPDDRARVEQEFREASARQGRYTMEYRFIRRDGAVRNILCNTNVIRLFGVDEPVQLAVSNDITDLREAQRKESETADKLSAVLNHAGNGITAIALLRGKPEFLFANDKYFEIVGYAREAYRTATAADMLALIHTDDRETLRAQVSEINQQGGDLSSEYRVVRGDGKTVWIRSAITVTRLAGVAAPVQIAIFSDITAEKEASEQLRFLNDSAHDLLAQPDSEIAINRTLERLLAYFDGDRAYVIELDNERQVSNNTYERCAKGVSSEMPRLQGVPFAVSDFWLEALRKNEYVVIDDAGRIDDSRSELRDLLIAQGIRALIIAPLWRDGTLVGFVGIDNPAKATDQLDRLKALGDYIAILLMRRDLSAKINSDRQMMTALMNDTPGGFVRMKRNDSGTFIPVYCNAGFGKLVGMDSETLHAIYGGDALAGVHPDDLDIVRRAGERMLADGEAESARFRVRSGSGDYIWLTLYGRMTKDATGGVYLNVYYSDASRQISEEQKRRAVDDQRKELLDNLPCGAALYEYDGQELTVVHINKSYWELVERAPADYAKTSVFDVIHPDDRLSVRQEIASAIRQSRNASVSIRILCGKSGYQPFRIDAKITPGENGKHQIFAAYTPISEKTLSLQEMIPVALSTMMSMSDDLSYVLDRDLHYICCSRSVAEMLGLASERDIIGKTDRDLFSAELAEQLTQDNAKVLQTGEPLLDHVERIVAHDGGVRLVSASKYPVTDASGGVIGLYGISRDITAQSERESRFKLLANSIPGGIATFLCAPGELRLIYFNDGLCGLSGYSREEFSHLKLSPIDMVFPEDRPTLDAQIAALLKAETPVDCILRVHTRGDGYKWVSCKAVAVERADAALVVNAVLTDITEQQEEKERLRVSEELNRLAIEHSGNIITRFDVQSRTLTLPNAFNPIFVLPHILNNMPDEQIALGRVSPDTADIYRSLFEDIVRGQASGTATYKQNSTKGWRWLEAQYTTVFSNMGKPVSAVISFTDITERLEKEVVYNKWQQSLEERPEESYTLFRCNLSKGVSFDSREGKLLRIEFDEADQTFDARTAEYAARYVYEEDREKYLTFVKSDTMLAEYYRGHRSDVIEYRETDGAGNARWLRLTVDLVEYPNSRDVEAYLMYEDIDRQKRTELLTLQRSETDPLTGILNRTAFITKMEQILHAARPDQQYALLMMDVDNFKHVNDTLGHGAGDQVLRDLTREIRAILRRDDLIGRLGGDEFFVFLKGVPGKAAAAGKAKQICDLRIAVQGSDLTVTTSIGIAMIPENGADFDTLYRKVDHALYQRKEEGKNGYRFADE